MNPRFKVKNYVKASAALILSLIIVIPTALSASAYQTTGLMFYFDFSNLGSTSDGTSLTDLSGNGRNGTIRGTGITSDSVNKAIKFPGGSTGTNYVELAGSFDDFTNGVSIEFEGNFGTSLSAWERIFDFGSSFSANSSDNQFWVGHMYNSGELALETWINGVNQGRCHTSTGGTALDTTGTFAKWLITVDSAKCRIYKNGVEQNTQIMNAAYTYDSPVSANGSAYPLPNNVTRTANFLGRSNWTGDQDLEGSIRYIRMYNTALTSTQAQENAVTSYAVTYDEQGGSSVADGTFTQGGSLTFPTNPTKSGYTFVGWFTASTGGVQKTASQVSADNASVTLYARWSANTYNVTYDEHGGSNVSDGSYVYGNTLSYPTAPTRSGYTFAGWFASASGGQALPATTVSTGTADVTLHAQWTPLPAQTITWAPSNTSVQRSQSTLTPSSAATTSGDGQISYSVTSAGASGCTVDSSSGVLSFTGVGVCVIRATAASTVNYLSATRDVSFNITSTAPAISLALDMTSGATVANSNVNYAASGLQNNSAWSLVVRSNPQTIASGTYSNSLLSGSAQIPSGLSAGWHSITLTGTGSNGETVSHAVWFEVSNSGTLLQTSGTGPASPTSSPAGLAQTGGNTDSIWIGILLVLAGVAFMGLKKITSRNS